MINAEEMLFVVDENNEPIEPKTRKVAHQNLMWHRTTDIWVINRLGQVLCQKRSLKKDVKPGFWEAFFGGHLSPGQEYIDNAVTELNEELGVNITASDLIPYKILKSDKPTHKEFPMIFGLIIDRTDTNFDFEREEIDQLRWENIEKVKKVLVDERNQNWVLKPWDDDVIKWISTLI